MDKVDQHTQDNFLGGRVRLKQPQEGCRATSDAILLAAAVRSKKGETLLDVGTATGVVALCVAARVENLCLTGIELQPELAQLACENALLNQKDFTVICQDIENKKDILHGVQFHHVVTNPPFYTEDHIRKNAQQATAFKEQVSLKTWLCYCLRHLRPKGTLTLIHRMEAVPEILSILDGRLGALEIIPIQSKPDKASKRVIVRGILGSRKPFELKSSLLMYEMNGTPTKQAEDILRCAMPIE